MQQKIAECKLLSVSGRVLLLSLKLVSLQHRDTHSKTLTLVHKLLIPTHEHKVSNLNPTEQAQRVSREQRQSAFTLGGGQNSAFTLGDKTQKTGGGV